MTDRLRLHCYAAAFGGDFVARKISAFTAKGEVILDPFCGSGTVLIQSMMHERHAIGIDVDPIACLISKVASTRYSHRRLASFRNWVETEVHRIREASRPATHLSRSLVAGATFRLNGYLASIPDYPGVDFWFSANQKQVLAALVQISQRVPRGKYRDLLRVSISSAIIRKWPNTLSRAMDIDHSRPHRARPRWVHVGAIYEQFLRVFARTVSVASHISSRLSPSTDCRLIRGDAASELARLDPESVDFILASPPYVGAIDYPRAHKFSEWWVREVGADPICCRRNYIGVRPILRSASAMEPECFRLLPGIMPSLSWLKHSAPNRYSRLCQYVLDIEGVANQLRRVLKNGRHALLVLANNRVNGRIVPVVSIVSRLLANAGFARVTVRRRRIKHTKRRYPYGIRTFAGPMVSEYVLLAEA